MNVSTVTILGVDDRPENLIALEAILADLDVTFKKASSGEEALEFLLQEEFALILLDVMMPGMDGYETATLIRGRKANKDTPIIFISAVNTKDEHLCKGYISGAVDYLAKPIIPEVLKRKVVIFVELYQQQKALMEKAGQLQTANEKIHFQQKALVNSEVRFRTAFEQSFQFMAILDPQGRVMELNRLAQKLCGDYHGTLIGQYLWNICWIGQDEENQRLQDVIFKAASGEMVSDEAKFIDINGRLTFLSRCVSPVLDEYGEVVNITVQGHDITARVRAEQEKRNLEQLLQQAQKMEALGALAGGIAHDFNNVLSVVLGNVDLAARNCRDDSPLHPFLQQIREAGDKAKDLVKQILSFSRQAEIEKIVMQPAKIIEETIRLLRSSIPTTIAIEHDIDRQCGAIFADPTQYHQIIMNLCTNAFHAMESRGGRLVIRLRQVRFAEEFIPDGLTGRPGVYAQLTVEDSGGGIDKEYMDKIFEPYFTTKGKDKGTGMGLAIVHGIVKGHGGTVKVESKKGEGTAIHVYLPLAENQKLQEVEEFSALTYGHERILLVDDERLLLDMLKKMLELIGYQVTAKNSSSEALEYFCDNHEEVDIVITDQTMPGMTGTDLARRILSLRPDIPIILCTGYSPNISRESVMTIGIQDLAFKPIALEELSKIIRRAIDGTT